jgi:8-oxo-dGTP pyrophosphatase MutT (NUDIX family)
MGKMPSGQIDSGQGRDTSHAAETIEQVALRELREETGLELCEDGRLIALGHYFSSPGFTNERGYFFSRAPGSPLQRAHTETKVNRFSIAANLVWKKYAA